MPPAYTFNFKFLALKGTKIKPELWMPVSPSTVHQPERNHFFSVIARLRAGASVESAQAEMIDIAGRLEQARPGTNRGWGVGVEALDDTQRGEYRLPLLTLFAGVGVVLLIACINIVNLLLAHNSSRKNEMAVRASLGATRWQITTQLLAESVWLCGSGSLFGLILAFGAIRLINNFRLEFDFDWPVISIDSTVLVFTLFVAALTAVIFGLLPAMRIPNVSSALKESVRTETTGKGRVRLDSILEGTSVRSQDLLPRKWRRGRSGFQPDRSGWKPDLPVLPLLSSDLRTVFGPTHAEREEQARFWASGASLLFPFRELTFSQLFTQGSQTAASG